MNVKVKLSQKAVTVGFQIGEIPRLLCDGGWAAGTAHQGCSVVHFIHKKNAFTPQVPSISQGVAPGHGRAVAGVPPCRRRVPRAEAAPAAAESERFSKI